MADSEEIDAALGFMARFELEQEQFDTLATYVSIMMRAKDDENPDLDVIKEHAVDLKVTRAELEDLRSNIFDILLDVAKMVDKQAEEDGETDTTITENGVGVFKHERLTRAVVNVINGMPLEEASKRSGIVEPALDGLSGLFSARIMYMGACALKANPDWSALDVLKSLSNLETFAEWNDQAAEYLEEDADAEEAEESDDAEEII